VRNLLAGVFAEWSEGYRRPGLYWYGALAKPSALAYRLVEWINRRRYGKTTLPGPRQAHLVVISSPLVGGVGKTPLAAYLASALRQRGHRVAIVNLGYGREARGAFVLTHTTDLPDATMVGDEALELWRTAGVPVHVGDEPAEVIAELDREGSFDTIVFDDGVRRRWESERRVVVLTARDLEQPVRFVPDGRWRTSPGVVAQAAAAAITDANDLSSELRDRHRRALTDWGHSGPTAWFATRHTGLSSIRAASDGPEVAPADKRPFVFCGVGMPARFLAQVRAAGFEPGGVRLFPDHHRYRPEDWARLDAQRRREDCSWCLTTHKDAVKFDPAWLGSTPVYFLRISLQQVAGDDLVRVIRDEG